jgi:AcrR family transcriptional regulator
MAHGREVDGGSVREAGAPASARERILEAAYRLFCRHGIQAVGIDTIVAEAHVAKMTLYHYFPSKEDLVLAFLDLREQRWTREWLEAGVERRVVTPQERLLSVFDLLDGWFRRRDYEGCPFISALLELNDKSSPIHAAAIRHIEVVRAMLERLAAQAACTDPEVTAYELQILVMGAIVSASRGDLDAAARARRLAQMLIEQS